MNNREQGTGNREQSFWGYATRYPLPATRLVRLLLIVHCSLLIALFAGCTGSSEAPLPALLAVGVNLSLITIPVLVLFVAIQRAFIESIAASGVKG